MASETLSGRPAKFQRGLTEVADGIHAWLQPNGGWGEVNAGLVLGDGQAAVIDTLWDEPKATEMMAAFEPLIGDRRLGTVINSHSDGDHCWGNSVMPADAEIITSPRSLEIMRSDDGPPGLVRMQKLGSVFSRLPGPPGGLGRYVGPMLAPFDFAGTTFRPADRAFDDGETVDIGGREAQVHIVGPAHTEGDAIVHIPDAGVVFCGDIVFFGATPVMWSGPPERWLAAIDKLLKLEPKVVVAGHGPPSGPEVVAEARAYLAWIIEEAERRREAGLSALDATREMFKADEFRARSGLECPERLYLTVNTVHSFGSGDGPPSESPLERIKLFSRVAQLRAELANV